MTEIIDSGAWGEDTHWALYLSEDVPDPALCTTVAGVPIIVGGQDQEPQVVLTCNTGRTAGRKGKWEILGGHIDPLDPANPNGPREGLRQALDREALEEAGFKVSQAVPFAYRRITNPPSSHYPELAYSPFYWMTTDHPRIPPTDRPQPATGAFYRWDVEALAEAGAMTVSELTIVRYGLAAAKRHSYGRIAA